MIVLKVKKSFKPLSIKTIISILSLQNHYSNITDNFNSSCVACTTCTKYAKQCTAEEDAVCMDDPEATTSDPEATTIRRHTPTVRPEGKKKLIVPKSTTGKYYSFITMGNGFSIILDLLIFFSEVIYSY